MSYLRVEFHVLHPSPSPESGKGFLAAGFLLRRNRAIRLLPVRDFCSGAYTKTYNPYIEGWINYYGQFYRTQLRSTLKRIDVYVIRWARRKYKRLRHKTKGARDWFEGLRRANRTLFAHWQLCHGNGRTTGAV